MAREEFDRILAGEPPRSFVQPWDHRMVFTPGEHALDPVVQPDGTSVGKDWFGCTWTEMPGGGPIDGATITPGTEPFEEVADCVAAIPSAEQVRAFDWEGCAAAQLKDHKRDSQILEVRSLVGFFERMHCMIGFENALCSFYEDPDGVHDFFAAMLEYKQVAAECTKK